LVGRERFGPPAVKDAGPANAETASPLFLKQLGTGQLTPNPGTLATVMRKYAGGNPTLHWWANPGSHGYFQYPPALLC